MRKKRVDTDPILSHGGMFNGVCMAVDTDDIFWGGYITITIHDLLGVPRMDVDYCGNTDTRGYQWFNIGSNEV